MTRRLSVLVALVLVAGAVSAGPPVPRTELTVKVPDYVSKRQGELTEVTVPGGGVLYIEEGRPEVPYFTSWFGYPKQCRIQDVTLKDRTGAKVDSGLRLPVAHFSSYNDPVPDIAPKTGLYPAEDFTWRVVEETGDSITLAITVYPYRFDPGTGIGTFHSQYAFGVRYVTADVGIRSVSHVSPVCDPGDTLRTVVRLEGAAEAQDVTVKSTVLDAATGKAVAGLPELKPGVADSVVVEWPTARTAKGNYLMELVLGDPSGNELDRKRASFRIGNPQGEVTGFAVGPQVFDIGDDIKLTLGFKNTGSVVLDGRCVFRITKDDAVVDQFEQAMTGLKPGASKTFTQSWNTADAEKSAIYHAVGFVKYEGTASGHRSAMFSTNRMPEAVFTALPDSAAGGEEVSFDASGSKDADGEIVEYRWEFGDGGKADDITAAHVYMQPGEFTVRLTVVDDEGGTATAEQTIVVTE